MARFPFLGGCFATASSMLVSAAGFSAFLAVYGRRTTVTYNEEVLLVLGGGIRQGEIQDVLQRRLDKAIAYHHQNPDAIIIVSGGTGYMELYSEAAVMARYLINHGIPADRILKEEDSYSTFTNMTYSKAVFENYVIPYRDTDSRPAAVIITNDFHMFRSLSFAERVGFDARAYPARTPSHNMPFLYARETAAVIKMWVIGR